jgi:peptidoglycan hydrolase-like protein with peptidoglycan-binding domain
MVLFVGKLSNYAKTRNPNFAIIMQNAEVLLKYEALREVIDGVAKESLLYGGDGPEKPNSAADVATTKQALDLAKAAGRTVFVVEYLNDPVKVKEATSKLASLGFLSTFSDRSRSLASINRFPVSDFPVNIGEELRSLPEPANQPSDGVLFAHSPAPFLAPQGMLVKVLQLSLQQQNFFAGTVNSRYDGPTVDAIKKFQQSKGRTADGICRNIDWDDITGMPAPSIFDRCLNLTAAFEGTGFTRACGAFDDGWLTWGIIGFTLSSDLPKFLEFVESQRSGTLARAFGNNEPELRRILKASKAEQQRWAESISITKNKIANYGLRQDWEDGFAALGSYLEVQILQIRVARSNYWDKLCVRDCKAYKAADVLDVAMLYETAVQNGGITRPELKGPFDQYVRNQPNSSGKARRQQWAEMIANGSKPQWHNDVLKRRMMFANGEGKVHGDSYRLADWGLDATRVDPEKLLAEHITFMPPDFGSAVRPKPTPPAGPLESTVSTAAGTYDLAANFMPAMAVAISKVGRPGIDANWGPVAPIGLDDLLGQNNAALPADWRQWPDDRRATALVQLVGKAKGQYSSDIDGWWGQLVQWAFDQLVCLRTSNRTDNNWRDSDEPIDVNPHGWPLESRDQQALIAFYGQPGNVKLVKVACPWPMHLTWDPSSKVKSISIHEKLGDSLTKILEAVHKHYGDTKLKELGLDRFSGSYNPRPMTGTDPPRPSLHSYGIAVDWDDDRNQYRWTRDKARMAKPEYRDWWQIWESEGWCSLGRVKDFDWMHVQAAKRT